MEAARNSETSVDNYFTRQYIPEDNSELPYIVFQQVKYVRFEVITVLRVFWDIEPCSFRGTYCLHHQAVRPSETSVPFSETARRCIPEDPHLQEVKSLKYMIFHITGF
jgi:hypothetical protein